MSRLPHLVVQACRMLWAADRRTFLAASVTMLVSGLAVGPRLLGVRDLLEAMSLPAETRTTADFAVPLILVSLCTIAIETAGNARPHLERLLDATSARLAQESILRVAAAAPYSRFDDPEFHDALDRAARGSELRPVQVVQGVNSIISAGLAAITLILAVISSSLIVAAFLSAAYVPVIVVQMRSGLRYYQVHDRLTQDDRMRGYLVRLLTARTSVAELRFHGSDRELARRVTLAWEQRLIGIRALTNGRLRATVGSAGSASVATIAAAVVLVWLFERGELTVAVAGLLLVAMWEFGAALSALGWGMANLTEAGLFLDDYSRFVAMAAQGRLEQQEGQVAMPRTGDEAPSVALDAVSFTYPGSTEPVLRGVSLEVTASQIIAVVGHSGAGKSTIMKLLAGLYQPSEGVMRWAGTPLGTEHSAALRHHVAVMMQDFGRYAMSIRENIALHDISRVEDTAAIVDAARVAGIHSFVEGLPDKYDTRLGIEFEGGVDLSVGQWQRVALARAVFSRADLVVLDEPTSSLDPETEREFIGRLRRSCAGRAVVLISHRFSTVRDVDRIFVLEQGRLVESGHPAELLAAQGAYWRLFAREGEPDT